MVVIAKRKEIRYATPLPIQALHYLLLILIVAILVKNKTNQEEEGFINLIHAT